MDVVTLGMAKADAKKNYENPKKRQDQLWRFRKMLSIGTGTVLCFGDSWTEGTRGSDSPWLRYVDHLAAALRRAGQPAGIAGGMYIPSYATYATKLPANWVFAGSTTQKQVSGPGYYNVEMANAATATLAFTGTGFKIHWDRRTDGATAVGVTIDGVSVGTIDSSGATHYGMTTSFTGLNPGKHTIVLTVTTGTVFSFQGAYAFNGDETSGIKLYASGRGGIKSDAVTQVGFVGNLQATVPDLITFEYGINDYRNAIPVATFKANLASAIDTIRGRSVDADASIAIISCPEAVIGGIPAVAPWQDYKDAMAALANEKNVLLIDLTPVFGTGVLTETKGLADVDHVHPNDAGHLAIANRILSEIVPTAVRAAVPTEKLFIPAGEMVGQTLETISNMQVDRPLRDAQSDVAVVNASIPTDWRAFDADLLFFNKSANAGDVRLRLIAGTIPIGKAAANDVDFQATVTAGAQNIATVAKSFVAGLTTDPSGLAKFMVSRLGSDAADTLVGDIGLFGIWLRRTK